MKLITKNSDYALRALVYLARKRSVLVSSREIASSEKIPLLFLRRILQVLLKHKIITSREGVNGGVCLRRPPARINVAEVVQVMQGEIQFSECMFRKKLCFNRSHCVLRRRIRRIEARVVEEFKKMTIAQLAADDH